MKLKDFMAAMQAIETDRKLSKEVVVDALQEALAKAFRKHIEIPDALVRVDVNEKSGDIKVYQQRLIDPAASLSQHPAPSAAALHVITARVAHIHPVPDCR